MGSRQIMGRWAAVWALLAALGGAAWGAPSVSNVRAGQRGDGSGLVDVWYDLAGGAGPMMVYVVFSRDGGQTWNLNPILSSLTGDLGAGIANGTNRHIVWDAARQYPQVYWPQCQAKVTAVENSGSATITILLPGNPQVPLDLVRIPAGTFQMGAPTYERSSSASERPRHPVTFAQDFYIGKYEVTQKQWAIVMGSNPANSYGVGDDYPVYNVSWNGIAGAGGFIERLNFYLADRGMGSVRLPSEAEWEYACRATTPWRFYFGDSLTNALGFPIDDAGADGPAGALAGNRSDYMWYSGNSGNATHPVGQKLPNAFGLYDISGNVWEWCQDWWHGDYNGAPADGSAWVSPTPDYRVIRGGSWYNYVYNCRSASRGYYYPDARLGYYGFRLARTP